MNRSIFSQLLLAGLGAAAATACVADDGSLSLDTADQELIGGKAVDSAAFDAVGALGVDPDGNGSYTPFCTGTLVAPSLVLSSEHCLRAYPAEQVAFLIGPKASAPRAIAHGRAAVLEESFAGGVIGLGAAVGVLHLTAPVAGVTPLRYAALDDSAIGDDFLGYGYGVRDDHGNRGKRRAGTMALLGTSGPVLQLIFDSFDDFLSDGARALFPHLDRHRASDRRILRERFDGLPLLDGAEAWVGGSCGDAQACDGDGGGPITAKVGGVETVFGVASWAFQICEFGAAYATLTGPALDLVDREIACPLLPSNGLCDGDVAVRCSEPNEGLRRRIDNDCSELAQTCGFGADGKVACVDPV
jgi:hypothetical protein